MSDQLLATFYVQSPEFLYGDITVTARVTQQSGNDWWENTSELRCVVTNAHYEDGNGLRRRYRIDVFRVAVEEWQWNDSTGQSELTWFYYRLRNAGTYRRRLEVRFNNTPNTSPPSLARMLYITIQPDLHVYVKEEDRTIDMIRTDATVISQNPLVRTVNVNVVETSEALAARDIAVTQSTNYKGSVFIKSNFLVDAYSDDFSLESGVDEWGSSADTWLRLKNQIRLTRRIGNSLYRWHDGWGSNPIIHTDAQGEHVRFITDSNNSDYESALLNATSPDAVELGLEKPLLELSLAVKSALTLYGRATPRYTGNGETITSTEPVLLPLQVAMKTVHAVKITPTVVTLDEDNNYTAFVAVEANDDTHWTFYDIDDRITLSPSSGTGRAAVIVRKADSFQLWHEHFIQVPLNIVSTVNAVEYPDIDGSYSASDSADVHIEQYVPDRNALIPRQEGGSFDRSLSTHGSVGTWNNNLHFNNSVFDNIDDFPTVEVALDKPHRIRSWSLQSVGAVSNAPRATVLALTGRTLNGTWRMLDLARLPNEWVYNDNESFQYALYTDDKCRVDRAAQHAELVDTIRIIVLAVEGGNSGMVRLPQIQVFAGVPLLPRMNSNTTSGITVRANDSHHGVRVFDRAVSGSNVASIGSRAWYVNNNHFMLDDVAENGNISEFGSYQSKGWFSLIFPRTRLLGYLYSIDNLRGRSDNHANTSYAASLYFEGRETPDNEATLEPSHTHWDFIDLISLDHCIGHNDFGLSTAVLVSEANQATLNTYAQNLGLPVVDKTFLTNRNDRHIIRYDAAAQQWYDDGMRLAPGTTATNQFGNMTTETLLAESGQRRLNDVALVRGQAMQPPWSSVPDKAAIVNQVDAKRMIYDLASETWSETANNDAIYHVHDRTHYADLQDAAGNLLTLAQLRCTVQSIMNTEKPSVAGEPVAMPEMQLFGLPADTINSSAVATVTFLKAEDENGHLHDILGKHVTLPYQRLETWWNWSTMSYTTRFRFYIGEVQHVRSNDRRLYFSIQNTSGNMVTTSVSLDSTSSVHRDISVSGNYTTSPAYFEVYINSANDEKIILSSGYTGGQL